MIDEQQTKLKNSVNDLIELFGTINSWAKPLLILVIPGGVLCLLGLAMAVVGMTPAIALDTALRLFGPDDD